jgi:hypothetical protein
VISAYDVAADRLYGRIKRRKGRLMRRGSERPLSDAPPWDNPRASIPDVPMTQQYIIGQFSALLGDLQPPPGECLEETVHDLRREVESCPLARLPKLAHEAIA